MSEPSYQIIKFYNLKSLLSNISFWEVNHLKFFVVNIVSFWVKQHCIKAHEEICDTIEIQNKWFHSKESITNGAASQMNGAMSKYTCKCDKVRCKRLLQIEQQVFVSFSPNLFRSICYGYIMVRWIWHWAVTFSTFGTEFCSGYFWLCLTFTFGIVCTVYCLTKCQVKQTIKEHFFL